MRWLYNSAYQYHIYILRRNQIRPARSNSANAIAASGPVAASLWIPGYAAL